jgi:cation diffusion facilitator CzcD-associated flavoprotein CzcO
MLTPKEKVANWLEMYSETQDLVVWTSTTVTNESAPVYDAAAGRWTLSVVRNGELITLRPAHIVLATGTLGAPNVPSIPHQDLFSGKVMHASAYKNGAPFAGQRVLVVGSANTAADVCGDLVGAKATVTLLQRSPTSVVLPDALHAFFELASPVGLAPGVGDFKWLAVPHKLREKLALEMGAAMLAAGLDPDCASEEDARRKAGMVARGFRFGTGPDGRGIFGQFNESFAGYCECMITFARALS